MPPRTRRLLALLALAAGAVGCRGGAGCSPPEQRPLRFAQIAARGDLTCGRSDAGEIWCWGDNAFDKLIPAEAEIPRTASRRMVPVKVKGVTGAVSLAVSRSHGCAVTQAGDVLCWRDGTVDVFPNAAPPPLAAAPIGIDDAVSVSASGENVARFCFVHRDGGASCAQAPAGGLPGAATRIAGLSSVAAVAPGDAQACALTKTGDVVCWGNNLLGALGEPDAPARPSPAGAPPALRGASRLAGATSQVCALKDGIVLCWGMSYAREPATSVGKPTPVPGIGPASRVETAVEHACAIVAGGGVRCWGRDNWGKRGPVGREVPGVSGAMDLALGDNHTCALVAAGDVSCWGRNNRGQLGDGTPNNSPTPRRLATP